VRSVRAVCGATTTSSRLPDSAAAAGSVTFVVKLLSTVNPVSIQDTKAVSIIVIASAMPVFVAARIAAKAIKNPDAPVY
jgi:hypothetical protein